jgi:hypothetical protein
MIHDLVLREKLSENRASLIAVPWLLNDNHNNI